MKLEMEDVMKVLNKEIEWCKNNPDKAFHKEYRKGFTNGLIQAKYLISMMEKLLEDDELYFPSAIG